MCNNSSVKHRRKAERIEKKFLFDFSDAQNKLVEPNPSESNRKAFQDVTPVVAFCRIWRWPDLNTHLELRSSDNCTYAFQHEKDQLCVNPFHYERVVAPRRLKQFLKKAEFDFLIS